MAQTLSYPNSIKDVYHKIVFTTSDSGESVPLYRTDSSTQVDSEITTLANLSELTYEVDSPSIMFSLKNYAQRKFTVYGDGTIQMFENSSLGTPLAGQIKNVNGNLYLGV
jgi:hypothetical protein